MSIRDLRDRDWQRLFDAVATLYDAADPRHFTQRVYDVLNSLVTADLISYDHVDLDQGTVTCELNRDFGRIWPDVRAAWTHFAPEHPIVQYSAAGGPRQVIRLDQLITKRELRQTGLYHDVFRQVGVEQQVALVPRSGHHLLGVALNRSSGRFTDREVALLEVICPHLLRAYLHTLSLAELAERRRAGESFEVLVLTADGIAASWSPGLLLMLREHFGSESEGRKQIEDFVAGAKPPLLAAAAPKRALLKTAAGELRLKLSLVPQAKGFMLVVSERQDFSIASEVQGKRDSEIAIILRLSRRTAEHHTLNILRKLGVETRTAAVAMAHGATGLD